MNAMIVRPPKFFSFFKWAHLQMTAIMLAHLKEKNEDTILDSLSLSNKFIFIKVVIIDGSERRA